MTATTPEELTTARTLASGEGWRVEEVVCRAGPGDAPYEERHDWVATAFREGLGVTPYNYILRHRLDAAARRLIEGSEPVLDIALDVGFGDLSEFTRRFRARFGRPPAAFRRSYGGARSRL